MSTGFFNGERKNFSPLVTILREPDFVMDWRKVAIAGRERKRLCGAFKARKSGAEGLNLAPFVTYWSQPLFDGKQRLLRANNERPRTFPLILN